MKFKKKKILLSLNKSTISNLNRDDMDQLLAGDGDCTKCTVSCREDVDCPWEGGPREGPTLIYSNNGGTCDPGPGPN